MSDMFCFQCEQTAGGKACTTAGVCGKKAATSRFQDELIGALVGLARAASGGHIYADTNLVVMEGLFTTITNVSFDDEALKKQIEKTEAEKRRYSSGCTGCCGCCGQKDNLDMSQLWEADEDVRSLKSLLLLGMKGMAAYAYHAWVLGYADEEINSFFYKGLTAIGEDLSAEALLGLVLECGNVNYKCMALLDKANTSTYGTPVPTQVTTYIEKGPFIIVSGHDLKDLQLLLEQTAGKGIHIYTHGEMLPCHAYPELKKHAHLKGNFGTAWQNQQKEFADIPGPVLFTTNCIMPVKDSYRDRIFTTEVVSYPGMIHIGEDKDFTPVIQKALELGGYPEEHKMTGINGGNTLTCGFGHGTVLAAAGQIVEAVKKGAVRHFFLVGGCDGARPGRNYYTEFVQKTPADSIILTLACGKYRFNDLDLGKIGEFPRIMDMGQCNDAYSAIQVALALAQAFGVSVNELPLSIVLSWYEQKAVCVLLTLLALGVRNIYIGPSLPAFVSPNVLKILVEQFQITPISTPEEDLKRLLG